MARVSGIPPERVLLCCSHTHYGPVVDEEWEGGDTPLAQAYLAALPHLVAGAVGAAAGGLRPVTLAVGRGQVRVGVNRRERRPDGRIVLGQNPQGRPRSGGPGVAPGPCRRTRRGRAGRAGHPPPPASAGASAGPSAGREPLAVVVNYACHPVSLGGGMRLISADFPGVAREVVQRLVGGTALFLQGACGDINPVAMGPDWDHSRRLGHALGAAASQAALAGPAGGGDAVAPGPGDGRPPAPPALLAGAGAGAGGGRWRRRGSACEARRAGRGSGGGTGGAWSGPGGRWWPWREGQPVPPLPAPLAALRLGDAALATNPGELFCEIGMAIKGGSPFPWTAVAGYTDAAVWYVPTRAAYAEGGYEVEWACRVAPEAGEVIQETGLKLLRSLT